MKTPLYLFLGFFALYVLSMGGHGYGGVGTTTYDVTRSIVLHGDVAISPVPWGKFGTDGRFYAQYGIGHSVYNLPFYLLGHSLTKLFPRLASQYDRVTMFTTLLGQPFISAWTVALLWLLCRKIDYTERIATWCALLYGLGTQVWMYATWDFSEPILTFFLVGMMYWLAIPENSGVAHDDLKTTHTLIAGICCGIAITVKIATVIVIPVCLVYLIQCQSSTSRWKRVLVFGLPVLIGLGTIGVYNMLRFGNPLETGYDNEFNFFYGRVVRQFWANLAGLEGSLFLYSPVALLSLFGVSQFYRRFRAFAILVFGVILSFFLFYPFTTNELYYGPRYLTPTLPLFMLIVGMALQKGKPTSIPSQKGKKWLIRGLLTVGICQQIIGVVVNYHTYYWRIQYTLPLADVAVRESLAGQLLLATPQLSPLLGNLWLIKQGLLDLFQPGGIPLSGATLLADTMQQNAWIPYYGLDLWWCNPQLIHMLGWGIWGACVLGLLGVLGWTATRMHFR